MGQFQTQEKSNGGDESLGTPPTNEGNEFDIAKNSDMEEAKDDEKGIQFKGAATPGNDEKVSPPPPPPHSFISSVLHMTHH